MNAAGFLDALRITRSQRLDVVKVLGDGDRVALALVGFVPLVVIVEDEADHVMEIFNEAIAGGVVDKPVKALIKAGEIVKPSLDVSKETTVLLLDPFQGRPSRGIRRLACESERRA